MATAPKTVDPPFYDPVLVSNSGGQQQHSQAWTEYHQAVADQLADVHTGVTDGSDAATGQVGEYLSAAGGSVTLTSTVTATAVSLSLTAGDWDVSGAVAFVAAPTTVPQGFAWGFNAPERSLVATFPAGASQNVEIGPRRVNVTATTAVQLSVVAFFTTSTMSAQGSISARRIR